MIDLSCKYQNEFEALIRLFGKEEVLSKVNRLNEIHHFTESIWNEYVSSIPEGEILYLLIAEAPPWSETGRPQYFLDHKSRSRSVLNAVKKAFFPTNFSSRLSNKEVLKELSQMGFLIIDSIPFSMDYSQSNKRSTVAYYKLISQSINGYFYEKINNPTLKWASELRIAFSLKRNALAVIDALDGRSILEKKQISIGEEQIAVNGAGYPDANKLKKNFGL